MYYSGIINFDIANGDGVGVSLFVSGCPHHCKGCFSQETWDYKFGQEFTNKELNKIINALGNNYYNHFSILGGEPLAPNNIDEVAKIISAINTMFPDKKIWIWTGYKFEDLKRRGEYTPSLFYILNTVDYIVDGKFEENKKNLSLKYRGSSNQRVFFRLKNGWKLLYK